MTSPIPERLAAVEVKISDIIIPAVAEVRQAQTGLATDIASVRERLDDLSLNGHGQDLKEFVNKGLPKVYELLAVANTLIDEANRARQKAAAWAWLSRSRWWRFGRWIAVLIIGGAISAFFFWLIEPGHIPPHLP